MQTLSLSTPTKTFIHSSSCLESHKRWKRWCFCLFVLFLLHSFLLSSWYHAFLWPFGLWFIKYLLFLLPLQLLPLHKFIPIRYKLSPIPPTRRKKTVKHLLTLFSLPSSSYFYSFLNTISQRINIFCLSFLISHLFLPSFLPDELVPSLSYLGGPPYGFEDSWSLPSSSHSPLS